MRATWLIAATFVFPIAAHPQGATFKALDRNGDGLISRGEANGSPYENESGAQSAPTGEAK